MSALCCFLSVTLAGLDLPSDLRAEVGPEKITFAVPVEDAGKTITLPRLYNPVRYASISPTAADGTQSPGTALPGGAAPHRDLLTFSQTSTHWQIRCPAADRLPANVELHLVGAPLLADREPLLGPGPDGVITLPAHTAAVHGSKLQYEPLPHKNTVGFWVNPSDWASWRVQVPQAATYRVQILQGCGSGQGGSTVAVQIAGRSLEFQVEETGHFQNFVWRELGALALPAGEHALELRVRRLANKAVMDVRQIRLVPSTEQPEATAAPPPTQDLDRDMSEVAVDVTVPPLFEGPPAPGRRVVQTTAGWNPPAVYHTTWLPVDWNKGRRWPVIVEWTGNGGYDDGKGGRCTGRVEDAAFGFGLTAGQGYILLSVPFLNAAGSANVTTWWGDPPTHDPQPTLKYVAATVDAVCRDWAGDAERVVLIGFSRGSLAANALGLHDDEIARRWRAFVEFSHYDGMNRWPYAGSDRAAAQARLARLGDRPQLLLDEANSAGVARQQQLAAYLAEAAPTGKFTLGLTGFRNHHDQWALRPSPARTAARAWLAEHVPPAGR